MKRILLYLSFLSLIFMGSCELFEQDPPRDFVPDSPDASGNLLIINNSTERLVLYKDEYIVKKIPASATDYLVNIPNEAEGTIELDLYLWEDVKEDPNNPDPSKAYKKWLVPLAASTDIEERATWHLDGISQYVNVATINFSYYGGTDEFVDIYLNGRTGAKIMSMMPGQQNKKVGIDFGNHTVHYHYWFSDQNDGEAFESLDWIDKENVNGDEKDIWLILNENRKDVTAIIPHLGFAQSNATIYGSLHITNVSGDPVQIYAGDKLIESVCYLEKGSPLNLSTLDRKGVYTFVLPITQEGATEAEYIVTAKHLTNGSDIETATVKIIAGETTSWKVDGEVDIVEEEPVEETPVEEPPADSTGVL